ncbi:DUF4382 domain-containing protein [Aliifodinibius sp. S!AR15-10]|uniref:DUF4382 domain-containing protein n=1 Tax=Aliifodinibius sp. S!AR15-10 TaxID=2950437 RepID=UPI00285FE8CF|nr:DUF4382 domain-containing protein [Aliifodinibius sp. S!AR15-10]MDR8390297.1 DUF4382 domain-containing protein [Aliifodinibius sp. S!AR15-10]
MVTRKLQHYLIVLLLGVGLLAAGCNNSGSDVGMGTLEVRMHDAPANYDAVNVFVERVEINAEQDTAGWMTISEPQQSYNLLELTNGAYTVLGDTTLEAGTYNQIRLILSREGHSVVVDGEEKSMFVPSGAQTGIKLNVNAEIQEDITYTLLLDFDASRSVVKRGNGQANPGYLLKPVIHASNQAVTGNIDGTVSPVDAEPVVYAIADSDTLASTYADTTDGYFKLIGLEEGSYTVSINPTNEDYSIKDTTDVGVTVGETNELGTIELEQAQ